MVDFLEINHLVFKYALSTENNLRDINLKVKRGDFLLVVGNSGSGKTTLLRQLKKELWPAGMRKGELVFEGQLLSELNSIKSAQEIGMVFQNPDDQLVMDTVIQELAFSLENIGEKDENIRRRIAEIVSFFGFQEILYKSVNQLSGGQKQLVNLAAVLILQPKLLLLDEPTAQLDPIAAKEFINLLQRVHDELGVTIIINEHQLDEILPIATRMLILDDGKVFFEGDITEGLQQIAGNGKLMKFIPDIPRFFLENKIVDTEISKIPLTVVDGKRILIASKIAFKQQRRPMIKSGSETVVKATHLDFQYSKKDRLILNNLNLSVNKGECLAIVGRNGTGKSTLLKCLMGFEKIRRGRIEILGRALKKWDFKELYQAVGFLSQNPEIYFSYDSVYEELFRRAEQIGEKHPKQKVREILEQLQISELADKNPHDTSGGEKQLIALGIILVSNPSILILDEPTKGIDPTRKAQLGEILKELQKSGISIIMTSHDMTFCARFASHCAMLFEGEVVSEGSPYAFFASNFFYTTPINRMIRYQVPEALIWEELIT